MDPRVGPRRMQDIFTRDGRLRRPDPPPPAHTPPPVVDDESSEGMTPADIAREKPSTKIVREYFKEYFKQIQSEEERLFDRPDNIA